MDEKSAPITVVPAISKQPVDLYRLYHLVKERGGMVEVRRYVVSILYSLGCYTRVKAWCTFG